MNGESLNDDMLSHTDLKKGVMIILDKEPYEVLEARPLKKAQDQPVIQSKVKNLLTGNVVNQNFHQGDVFEEAELLKFKAKFLYSHRNRYFFCSENNHSKRFDLDSEQIGFRAKFLRPNLIVETLVFDEKIINISLPIKIQLKVTEAPPGIKGNRVQGGTKIVTLESGVKLNTPLFIEEGDIIEVNTETGEYAKRIE